MPSDYDRDPERFLSAGMYPHDDVHPHVAARFAAAGARRVLDVGGGNGRLARLLLTMRGCFVYATKAALSGGCRLRGGEHHPDLSAGEGHRLAGRGGERGAAVHAWP
jgi:hypothetical protein